MRMRVANVTWKNRAIPMIDNEQADTIDILYCLCYNIEYMGSGYLEDRL